MNGFALLAGLRHSKVIRFSIALTRVGAYVGVLGVALGVYGVHRAHASVAEGALELGRDMAPLAEYLTEPTSMSMNGEHMVIATGSTGKSVHEVLDQYETYCRTAAGNQGKEWSTLAAQGGPGKIDVSSKLGGSFDLGVYRVERREDGAVMCFMRGEASSATVMESLEKFQDTHDFGVLGKMRYAYVVAGDDGQAMVLTAWTDDHFRLDSFMAEDGADAPGSDPVGLPRPPQSRRLLAAQIESAPFGAHIYRSAATPDQVRSFYDDEMVKAGWLPIGWGDDKIDPGKNRVYMKEGIQVALATQTDEEGTLVSVGEAGAPATEASFPAVEGAP